MNRGPGRLDAAVAEVMHCERERRQWRQVDLAEQLGWPLSRVTRIESGDQRLVVGDLLSLCRALNLPLGGLLREADPDDLAAMGLTARQ